MAAVVHWRREALHSKCYAVANKPQDDDYQEKGKARINSMEFR